MLGALIVTVSSATGPARSTLIVTAPVPGVSALKIFGSTVTVTVVGTGVNVMEVIAVSPSWADAAEICAVSVAAKAREGAV